MIAYAYFDKNGNLLEFVSDPSVREGNLNENKIYAYIEELLPTKRISQHYKDASTNAEITGYNPIVDNEPVESIFPVIKKYDPKYFITGKTYPFIEVAIPDVVLANNGGKLLNLKTATIIDDEEVNVLYFQMISFYVEESVIHRTEINKAEYEYLIAYINEKISSKIDKFNTIISRTYIGDLSNDNIGQILFIHNNSEDKLYEVIQDNTNKTVKEIFDFRINIIVDAEVVKTEEDDNISYLVKLLNESDEVVFSFNIVIPSATTTQAGLMSAEDKITLNAIPSTYETKEHATSQHSALSSSIAAETSRATTEENKKEDKANKKTVINDSTKNDTNYASIKAVVDFVNSTVNSLAAFYITKNANGDAFSTLAELQAATVFYSGGTVRVPTRNDYCLVASDETHDDASCRYIYQGNQWEFQFVVNETAFTEAQLQAINSGITAGKVLSYDSHIIDNLIHITSAERTKWNKVEEKQNQVYYGNTEPEDAVEGDLWASEGEDLGDIEFGTGLKLENEDFGRVLSVDDEEVLMVPEEAPNNVEIVGIDSDGKQSRIQLGNNLSIRGTTSPFQLDAVNINIISQTFVLSGTVSSEMLTKIINTPGIDILQDGDRYFIKQSPGHYYALKRENSVMKVFSLTLNLSNGAWVVDTEEMVDTDSIQYLTAMKFLTGGITLPDLTKILFQDSEKNLNEILETLEDFVYYEKQITGNNSATETSVLNLEIGQRVFQNSPKSTSSKYGKSILTNTDGTIDGILVERPKTDRLYLNLSNKKLYRWNESSSQMNEVGAGGSGAVESVNGKTGVVVLNAADILMNDEDSIKKAFDDLTEEVARVEAEIPTNRQELSVIGGLVTPTTAPTVKELVGVNAQGDQIRVQLGSNLQFRGTTSPFQLDAVGGGSGDVSSVNGKTGAVVLNSNDIKANNAETIQENLERIDEEINRVEEEIPQTKEEIASIGSLVKPNTAPTAIEIVGIDTHGNQVRLLLNLADFQITGADGVFTLNLRVPGTYRMLDSNGDILKDVNDNTLLHS